MTGQDTSRILGHCHCKAVEFSIPASTDFSGAARCDCSFCRRRWAPNASVPFDALKVEKGQDYLSHYSWNTGTAHHYFCKKCGIYTFHQRRSDPNFYGVNVTCFDHINMRDFANAEITDGIQHPSDHHVDEGPDKGTDKDQD